MSSARKRTARAHVIAGLLATLFALIAAQSASDAPQLWFLALVSGGVAGLAYALIGLVGRFVTPWSSGSAGGQP